MKKKIINSKQINKKKSFNKKNNQKKFQLYKNNKKQIIFQNNKNIINKKTIAFFKILKKKITEKKIKKKKNFKIKVISFYKKIKSDQKRKIYIGPVNTIYKFSRPIYMFDLDTTVFAPEKYINWHNRVFIENFDQEKKFYVKPSAFNKVVDKNFKKFNISDYISSKIDKKINKKSNIQKIY